MRTLKCAATPVLAPSPTTHPDLASSRGAMPSRWAVLADLSTARPTGGSVLLNGQDYRAITPPELRRRVGMVMQTAHLFSGTVAANIIFGPSQTGETLPPKQMAALLERVGLPGYEQRDVSHLSGGE